MRISGLSADEAREKLVESLKDEAKTAAAGYINDIMDEAKMTANKEAKRIVIQSIQRVATETAVENSVTVFHIDNDEIKAESSVAKAATSVPSKPPPESKSSSTTPGGYRAFRLRSRAPRNSEARPAPARGGRTHPSRTYRGSGGKGPKQVEEEIIETQANEPPSTSVSTGCTLNLIRMVGKMKYRSSYGQNLLQHSRETANLCAVMASELGLNPKKARRAGLLHDIGKVPDDEPELPTRCSA